jgi:hypothetical protein
VGSWYIIYATLSGLEAGKLVVLDQSSLQSLCLHPAIAPLWYLFLLRTGSWLVLGWVLCTFHLWWQWGITSEKSCPWLQVTYTILDSVLFVWYPGICVCGSGAGTFVLAPFTAFLIRHFGWRGCNRVMALFCLACALFGLVMVPNKKKISKEILNNNEPQPQTRKEKSGLSLLCSIPFLLMTLGNIPFAMSVYITYTYLPSVSKSYLTHTTTPLSF